MPGWVIICANGFCHTAAPAATPSWQRPWWIWRRGAPIMPITGRTDWNTPYDGNSCGRSTRRASARLLQHQGGVHAAKAERIRQHELCAPAAAIALNVVQVARRIRRREIHRGRQPVVLQRQRADGRLDRSARAKRVAIVALGAAHRDAIRMVPEHLLDGERFR